MLQRIFRIIISLFKLVWQIFEFIWLAFIAFWDWLFHTSHPILKSNPFWAQLGFFFASLFFLPFPWWTSFIFLFLPPMWTVFILIGFYLMFIISLSSGIVFL